MASLEDIQRKQHELEQLAQQIAQEKDVQRIQEIAQRMQGAAQEVLRMGRALEASYAREEESGETRVVLTKGQRQRVAEATGVALDTLVLPGSESWVARMPRTSPATIERLAMASVADRTFREAKRKQAEAILKELEAIPDPLPETKAAIAEFKRQHLSS